MVTSAREWKGKVQVEGQDLPLPSGNVALVRQLEPTAFLNSGMIPDPLTSLIRKAIHTKQGLNPKDLEKIADDPKQLSAALELFDRVLSYCVVEPHVEMPPTCDVDVNGEPCGQYANTDIHQKPASSGHHAYHEGPRDPDVLYADQVVMDDKVFIFQWVLGGTHDLAKFRAELTRGVESVSDGQAVPGKAKRPARSR